MKKLMLFFMILILFSCKKKDEDYLISGTVSNPELNQAVANMQVTLMGTTVSNGTIQNQFTQVASATTDGNGSFNFKFSKAVYSALKIVLFRSDYIQQEQSVNPDNLSPGKDYKVNIQAHVLGWLKTTIQNTGTQHDADEIIYRLTLPYSSCTSCCGTSQRFFSGATTDTTWTCQVYGGSKIYIQWVYIYNSNNQPHYDTLQVPVNDTLSYPITY